MTVKSTLYTYVYADADAFSLHTTLLFFHPGKISQRLSGPDRTHFVRGDEDDGNSINKKWVRGKILLAAKLFTHFRKRGNNTNMNSKTKCVRICQHRN